MFEKPTAADITTGKKLTKAANATRDSPLIPSQYRARAVRTHSLRRGIRPAAERL